MTKCWNKKLLKSIPSNFCLKMMFFKITPKIWATAAVILSSRPFENSKIWTLPTNWRTFENYFYSTSECFIVVVTNYFYGSGWDSDGRAIVFDTRGLWFKISHRQNLISNIFTVWAVVVAQLVERSLLTPEVRGSNPVIGNNLYWIFSVNCIEKTKIKKKRPGLAHFLKITS